jgi:hypothetical protein
MVRLIERQIKNFQKKLLPIESGCIVWTGSKTSNGYGKFHFNGKCGRAHRFSWILHFGEIPAGLCVMHRCDNPLCTNIEHLSLGTHQENMRDRDNKGRNRQPKGEAQAHAKVTEKLVLEIRSRFGETQKDLAIEFGVQQATISQILRRQTWKHI